MFYISENRSADAMKICVEFICNVVKCFLSDCFSSVSFSHQVTNLTQMILFSKVTIARHILMSEMIADENYLL